MKATFGLPLPLLLWLPCTFSPPPSDAFVLVPRVCARSRHVTPPYFPTHSSGFGLQGVGGIAILDISQDMAEQIAGPFFGISLLPYLAFLYLLDREENNCPKSVTVGFGACLLFVLLTIPAAIAAKLLYGVSLADCDWLHGSAESLLTITNLVTVLAFRQSLDAYDKNVPQPNSAKSYRPTLLLVSVLTLFAGVTALLPIAMGSPQVHTPYLQGVLDIPLTLLESRGISEPDNALSVACWIIHISSLVEFLVAMGFCWRWADVVGNQKWKGLTWGLIPLHSSGITACTYHLFYNQIPVMIPLQAALTCIGNTTAAFAALRIALSNGWNPPKPLRGILGRRAASTPTAENQTTPPRESQSLVGFEDLGQALEDDTDYTFLLKLFLGCALASYIVKYGETLVEFPRDANVVVGLSMILVPSTLNAFKWYKRSQDPTFEGWF